MSIARIYILGTREFFDKTQPIWLDIKDEGAILLEERALNMPEMFYGQVSIFNPEDPESTEKLIKVIDAAPDFEQLVGPRPSSSGKGQIIHSTFSIQHPDLLGRLREEVNSFICSSN